MGRLVDIEDVKDFINGLDSLPWEEEVDDLVKTIPTAYDISKVVAELEELKSKYKVLHEVGEDYLEMFGLECRCLQISKDIEIVKRGGRNDINLCCCCRKEL